MSDAKKSQSQLLEEIRELRVLLASVKQPAAELSENQERFSLAMRGANDGLWDWNLETDDVYLSPSWKRMLGYRETELDGQVSAWASLIHPDDKGVATLKLNEYLNGGADSYDVELRMRHKDGHDIFILSRGLLVTRDSDNKAIRVVGMHTDITERKKAEVFADQHVKILEMIAIGCPASDVYNEIALMYESRHLGMRCSMLELVGNKLMHGGAPSLPKAYCEAVHGLENGSEVGSCGTSTYTGERVLVEDIATDPKWEKIKHLALPHGMRSCWSEPIKSSSGKVLGAFGMYYNHPALPDEEESNDLSAAARLASIVMERDQAQKRIFELAYRDELTGLSSRTHFYQYLEEAIRSSARHRRRFGVLYLDIDNFKDVNDSLGHDAGDFLLKTIAERLQYTCRDVDFVARLGGDEFCILAEEVGEDYAANVARRCLEALSQPIDIVGRKHMPTCSIGIAHYPDDGDDLSTLLKAADTSLYAAKENGKNQYTFYDQELTDKAEYRFQVEQLLREAIEQKQLSLVYQPQVNITSGEVVGVEALSRWHHPQLGQVPPNDFIATAERIGMIKPLTEWVLYTACHQAIAWQKAGLPALRMAVNISPKHFLDEGIVALVKSIIEETGITPSNLELEVTEGLVQTDQRNIAIFRELKELGVLLAIDDFGTGYSSFASLKHFKVDCLKIDKYFIDDMLVDKESLTLVSSMVEIGRKLGHGIIAEGVETEDQLEILRNLGCEAAQGYLFSQPADAATISTLLNSNFAV